MPGPQLHLATISWKLTGPDFIRGQYSREHTWEFDGGLIVSASPSPHVVPAPWSQPEHIDPEEAFIASIASCHMLTFLWLASKAGRVVEAYSDAASGVLTKNEQRVPWVSEVTLRPQIKWGDGTAPTVEELQQLHEQAHHHCFIANSVKSSIHVEPVA